MSGYVWSDFGVLANVSADKRMVIITNEAGSTRQMSIDKYKESAETVHYKCIPLIGKPVNIQTSQNTAKWDPLVWFSDIELNSDAASSFEHDITIGESEPRPDQLF